jgi:hypothetical protein
MSPEFGRIPVSCQFVSLSDLWLPRMCPNSTQIIIEWKLTGDRCRNVGATLSFKLCLSRKFKFRKIEIGTGIPEHLAASLDFNFRQNEQIEVPVSEIPCLEFHCPCPEFLF